MRLPQAPSTILSLVALLLSSQPVTAGPFSKISDLVYQSLRDAATDSIPQNHTLELRTVCGSSQLTCGFYGQLCCDAGNTCGTNAANQAICVAGAGSVTTAVASGAGSWQYYTSTYVETVGVVTKTSVYSSWVPAAVATGSSSTCSPNYANNETPCGPICCASGQYCYDSSSGVCKPAGAGGFTTTGVGAGAPVRPTTISGMITTQTISPTTTVPFQTPIAATSTGNATVIATSSHSGLSGGAIAGIVIGVLAAIIILGLICFCCCLKEAAAGILGIFGLGGGKKKSRRVVEEEYISSHHRHGSGAGSERRWYGAGAAGGSRPGSRPARPPPKKSGIGGLGAMGLGLGGLAVALGLKRKHDKKHVEEKSDISSAYYDSSYYGSNSSSKSHSHVRLSNHH